MKASKIVNIHTFFSKLKRNNIELPMFAHFHWSSITSIFYTFKRLGKCFFWVGEVRSGSEGLCHYININFYLSIIKLKIKNNCAISSLFYSWLQSLLYMVHAKNHFLSLKSSKCLQMVASFNIEQ